MTLENSLRRAIRRGQLALHYQPQVGLRGPLQSQLFGLEALVRWQHADGLLLPARFLPIAEESGLMVELSRWVLETAIAQRAAWRKQDASGVQQVPLAVNVPARQFHDRNLPATIQSMLRDCHLPAPLLELEVTESTLMQPSDASADVLRALRDMGVKLSIDDFGTGFSSFAQLKHFPLSKLKIDQSFVQQVTTNQSDAGITQAIISMAHHLGIASVAEGVENRAQQAFLADAGCTAMQGFVHCKPLPGEALSAFLAASSQPVVTTAVTARLH